MPGEIQIVKKISKNTKCEYKNLYCHF